LKGEGKKIFFPAIVFIVFLAASLHEELQNTIKTVFLKIPKTSKKVGVGRYVVFFLAPLGDAFPPYSTWRLHCMAGDIWT
jgi:hypothetical protein